MIKKLKGALYFKQINAFAYTGAGFLRKINNGDLTLKNKIHYCEVNLQIPK